MTSVDRLRLMTKVARLYHERGMRQSVIASKLSLTQATVSRLLAAAEKEGIVRTTVMTPMGVYPDLEEQLERRFGLSDAVVADCGEDRDDDVMREIGSAAATYLETTLGPEEVVGISSWSETLLRVVGSMQPVRRTSGSHVVQILGGIGNPTAEAHAVRLTEQLAALLSAQPHFLSAPGVTGSAAATEAYLADPQLEQTLGYFDRLTVALVGIGALHPSRLLDESGNVFSAEEQHELEELGAVGDICLRFFDDGGWPVTSPFDERVVGMSLEQIRKVSRSIGIAGGASKLAAIQAALQGGLVNVLITDRFTAERLIATALADPAGDHDWEIQA